MNPGLASSHTSGWVTFDDAAQKPTARVYQWMAEWENKMHDITVYDLEYRYPASGAADFRTLRVVKLYIPAGTVAKMKRAVSVES